MPEKGPGSVAAATPMPEARHSRGTAVPAKAEHISAAFSGHPSTQLQQPPRYPRAAHKQQTCTETITLCVTVLPPTSDTPQWNQCLAFHQPHVDLQDLTISVSCHMLMFLQDCQVHAPCLKQSTWFSVSQTPPGTGKRIVLDGVASATTQYSPDRFDAHIGTK